MLVLKEHLRFTGCNAFVFSKQVEQLAFYDDLCVRLESVNSRMVESRLWQLMNSMSVFGQETEVSLESGKKWVCYQPHSMLPKNAHRLMYIWIFICAEGISWHGRFTAVTVYSDPLTSLQRYEL